MDVNKQNAMAKRFVFAFTSLSQNMASLRAEKTDDEYCIMKQDMEQHTQERFLSDSGTFVPLSKHFSRFGTAVL